MKHWKLLMIIGLLFFILTGLTTFSQSDQMIKSEAIIRSANYQTNQFIVQVEINNKLYNGRFEQEPTYEEYLFFHHNEGSIIYLSYVIHEDGSLIIYNWSYGKK